MNIAPHEVGRILEAWSIRLSFQTGFVIGWTMLTALIVKEYGITMLPWMYMVNALLIVAGSFIYSQIIYAFENRKLIIVSVVTALQPARINSTRASSSGFPMTLGGRMPALVVTLTSLPRRMRRSAGVSWVSTVPFG